MEIITVGIVGYGNLGKAIEREITKNEDMKLRGIFTRRNCNEVIPSNKNIEVISFDDIEKFASEIDVLILCGGSAKDLDYQSPLLSKKFNVVDSYDTHAKIKEHFYEVDKGARKAKKTAIVSAGWDPGIFSIMRVLSEAILLKGNTYTFWGKGVSQGHSEAIRGIKGVKDAIQYTIPIEESLKKVRNFENPTLETRDKHTRECYVVVENEEEKYDIEKEIKNMPYYFNEYNTTVNFIHEEEMEKHKIKMPHGGFVLRSGVTGENDINNSIMELSLKLDSNPEFTASVLIAYARACYRLNKEGNIGAKTVLDIPIAYLSLFNGIEALGRLI